jgi:UDP-glucose 4-epimerase
MGVSKAMMEKLAISKGAIVTRYGNVMKSRGSVIPLWERAAKEGKPLKLTDPNMTRFLMSLDESIDLVMYALENGNPGEIFVKKAPASTMWTLAKAISDNIEIIGSRHGEKMHESLVSEEEMHRTENMGDYYCVKPDSRDLNYDQFFDNGDSKGTVKAYTSKNTERLDVTQVKGLLDGLK